MPATAAPLVLVFPTRLPALRLQTSAADESATSWIQVAVVGQYTDTRYGEFEITPAMLSAMVDNFSEGKFPEPPTEICVDYDHLTTKESKIPGDGKAAGWFKELQTRADGQELWARVEWTPAAASAIESKEYRFFSPYFTTNFETNTGKEIGPCLINGAITNRPFLQGMQPLSLALSRDSHLKGAGATWKGTVFALKASPVALAQLTDNDKRTRLELAIQQRFGTWRDDYYGWDAWLVDTIEGTDAIFCQRRQLASTSGYYKVGYAFGDDGTVTFTSEPQEVVNNWAELNAGADNGGKNLMAKIALTAANGTKFEIEQSELEQLPFVKALQAKLPPADAKVLSAAEFAAMDTSIKALQAESAANKTAADKANEAAEKANKALAQADADKKVDALVAAGKVTPAQKPQFVELALSNGEMFEKITKDMPVVVKLDTVKGSADAVAGDKGVKLQAAADALRATDPKLTADQAMAKALEAHPELYEG